MKCFYYLSPNLVSTQNISDDLHKAGINDWFLHVISNDESGLSKQHIHSSNYLETLDVIREGLMGAALGFIVGLIFAGTIKTTEYFGPDTPLIAFIGVTFLFSCFGAWLGGLDGISHKNRKIRQYQNDIDAGQYLVLIYANRKKEEQVREMMQRTHPEARLAGIDAKFYNPFSKPQIVNKPLN